MNELTGVADEVSSFLGISRSSVLPALYEEAPRRARGEGHPGVGHVDRDAHRAREDAVIEDVAGGRLAEDYLGTYEWLIRTKGNGFIDLR